MSMSNAPVKSPVERVCLACAHHTYNHMRLKRNKPKKKNKNNLRPAGPSWAKL